MSAPIGDGGPAFPVLDRANEGGLCAAGYGLSLRDYFAAHIDIPWSVAAEAVYRQKGNQNGTRAEIIAARTELRFEEADQMLKARSA